jgi:transcription initiation factor TFIID subunit 2
MDLSTVRSKLDTGQYTSRAEFEADFRLMISNAKQYTPNPKVFAHEQAVALEKFFNSGETALRDIQR